MKRDLVRLSTQNFDVLVVGSGIYGACVAWDAALRGLSVALIDKGDFGSATSANSLKIIHGGLRYLQDANLLLMRSMSNEQKTWLKIAPHLVRPLPCLVPTYQTLARSKVALAIGLRINDLISVDMNRKGHPDEIVHRGQILTKPEFLRRVPGIREDGITGGALWYDAQIYNTERLLLSIVLSAAEAGASVANYVEATGLSRKGQRITGVQARDWLTGQDFEIHAKIVCNNTGAWSDSLLGTSGSPSRPRFHLSTAVNLVTRQILPDYAVGFQSKYLDENNGDRERSRMLFIAPWRGCSIIGTIHTSYSGCPDDFQVSEQRIQEFIQEINNALPGAALTREDIYYVHSGFLPLIENYGSRRRFKLLRESQVHDHEIEDGLSGLITVIGVKYTTARKTAQKTVDLMVKKLGRKALPCKTDNSAVYGGRFDDFEQLLNNAKREPFGLGNDIMDHIVHTYGTHFPDVLESADKNASLLKPVSPGSPVLLAEITHAVRQEMALKVSDVLLRRTEIAATGRLDEGAIHACAEIMARELGWDSLTRQKAIEEARIDLKRFRAMAPESAGAN